MSPLFRQSVFHFLLLAWCVCARDTAEMSEQQNELSNGINKFSQDFYKAVAELNPNKNLIMSPLSAEIVLAMLSLGARGDTLNDLNKALYLPNSDFTRQAFKPAIQKLNAVEGVTLNVANKVFVKEGDKYVLAPAFKKDAVDIFQSEAENVNFAQSNKAAQIINSWVEKKTNDRIKDLIKAESLDEDTRLVLVNAIYFKGNWEKKFDKEMTRKRDFFLSATEKTQVDMMHKTAEFRYAEVPEWDAKILELPYEKRQMSMVIVLPNQVDGLAALEAKLATADLRQVLNTMYLADVTVALPKFRIESTIDLKKVLPKLGMGRLFDTRSELEGLLSSGEPLMVSEAVQKAFIEVNEEGAEAAAATGFKIMAISAPIPLNRAVFEARHPFRLLLVRARAPAPAGVVFCGSFGGR